VAGRRYRRGGGPADPSQRDAPAASSTRRGRGNPAAEPNRDPAELAREICLRQLAVRPRTRAELAAALHRRGIAEDVVDQVLDRYDEVGIINDEAFARAWVTSRHHGKGLARRALAGELRRKGVDAEAVDEALDELDPQTEEETARALVTRRMRVERNAAPDAAFRRLVGMLARKGYPAGLAIRVVKEALAAEAETAEFADGIDPDALAEAAEPGE
jgi:regulatory protein